MHVLLCPDSFKGSLSGPDVAAAMADGLRRVMPGVTTEIIPMADGGEGMARIVTDALGGEWRTVSVEGPNGSPVEAGWGFERVHHRAVLEVASACGLDLLPVAQRDPWHLHTRGVGQLIRAALDAGARQLLVGLGGSGTNDAGAGLLAALGVVFRDRQGVVLEPTPAGLANLAAVDFDHLDPRMRTVQLVLLTDVDNPLTGDHGASATFGPQKGLALDQVPAMDLRIQQVADRIASVRSLACAIDAPGMGAAGGLGFALGAVLGGTCRMGSDYIAELVGLDAAIARADLVITGEGCLDGQTVRGKVVAEVLRRASSLNKPVLAVAGSVRCSAEQIADLGLAGASSLCNEQVSVEEAIGRSAELVATRTGEAFRHWLEN